MHETVHALGVDYQQYARAQAEVIVDTTTLIVLGGLGLDVSGETVPYVAGWGEDGALDAVTQFAALIDALARRVEATLGTAGDGTNRPPGRLTRLRFASSRHISARGHACSRRKKRAFRVGRHDCRSARASVQRPNSVTFFTGREERGARARHDRPSAGMHGTR